VACKLSFHKAAALARIAVAAIFQGEGQLSLFGRPHVLKCSQGLPTNCQQSFRNSALCPAKNWADRATASPKLELLTMLSQV
jgi:hypothetical protein